MKDSTNLAAVMQNTWIPKEQKEPIQVKFTIPLGFTTCVSKESLINHNKNNVLS